MININENRIKSILRLSKRAFSRYRRQIITLTVLGFVGGILEGIGVNALIPLFSFALGDGQGGTDFISQVIKSLFGSLKISFSVPYLLAFIILLFVAKAFIAVYLNYIKIKITNDYAETTRKSLLSKILKANWPHLIKQKLGHLETILLIDVPTSTSLLQEISNSIMVGTSLLIYILVAINISLSITLLTLILGCVLFLLLKPLIFKIKNIASQRVNLNKQIAHQANESILGVKTFKVMNAAEKVVKRAAENFSELTSINLRLGILKSISSSFIQPIALIFICLIFAFSYRLPSFNFAALVAIIYLIQKIFVYIQQVQQSFNSVNESVSHLQSILNYEESAAQNIETASGTSNFVFNNSLIFKKINFSYNHGVKILKDIDLDVKKGEMIGLIGPSGVGKTTLVDIILRLLKPESGQILLDGIEIDKINLANWRKNIGYVSQDIFLINDTIRNNIKFYDHSISDDQVKKAARMANIYEFIKTIPDGFNALVGERGLTLSVGQRQRIVIARVLAKNPKFLIFDEATSALDNESEIKVQEVIKELKGKITVLVIAHRLSTIMDSDKLIVLENGQVTEQASPGDLLKNKESYFYKVYNIRQ